MASFIKYEEIVFTDLEIRININRTETKKK